MDKHNKDKFSILLNKHECHELMRGLRLCNQYALPDTANMENIYKTLEVHLMKCETK